MAFPTTFFHFCMQEALGKIKEGKSLSFPLYCLIMPRHFSPSPSCSSVREEMASVCKFRISGGREGEEG